MSLKSAARRRFRIPMNSTQIRVLAGCFLINLPVGVTFAFGNIYPYLYSYVRFVLSLESETDLSPAWLYPCLVVFRNMSILTSDYVKSRIGLRYGMLCGCLLYSSSLILTYASFHHSVWLTFVTFAILHGYAWGLTMSFNLALVTSHFDKNVGQATAFMSSSVGVGSIIVNFLVTGYVNPDNLSTDVKENGFTFFSQRSIVERTPMTWILIGVVATFCCTVGFCLVAFPKTAAGGTQRITDERKVDAVDINMDENEGQIITLHDFQPPTYDTCNGEGMDTNNSNRSNNSPRSMSINDAQSCTNRVQNIDKITPNKDKNLREALKSSSFYALLLYSTAATFNQLIMVNYYKMLGQLWISNDWFLTLTGNVSAIFLIVIRLSLGKMVDKYGVKNTLVTLLSTLCLLLILWYFTAMLNPWLFLIWTDTMMGLNANNVVLLPLAALKNFGSSKYIVIFGLFQTAVIVVNFAFPLLFSFLVNATDWFWVLLTGNGVMFVALSSVIVFLKGDNRA